MLYNDSIASHATIAQQIFKKECKWHYGIGKVGDSRNFVSLEICYASSVNEGFRYAKQFGIRAEEDHPFKALKQTCESKLEDQQGNFYSFFPFSDKFYHFHLILYRLKISFFYLKAALKIKDFKYLLESGEEKIIGVLKNQSITAGDLIAKEFQGYKEVGKRSQIIYFIV